MKHYWPKIVLMTLVAGILYCIFTRNTLLAHPNRVTRYFQNVVKSITYRTGLHYSSYKIVNLHREFQGALISESAGTLPILTASDGTPFMQGGRPILAQEQHLPVPQANEVEYTAGGGFFGINAPLFFSSKFWGTNFTITNNNVIAFHSATEKKFRNTGDRGFGIYTDGYRFDYTFRIRPLTSFSTSIIFSLRWGGVEIGYGPMVEYNSFSAKLDGVQFPYTNQFVPGTDTRIPSAIPFPIDRDVNFSVPITTGVWKINIYFSPRHNNDHLSIEIRTGVLSKDLNEIGFIEHNHLSLSYSSESNWFAPFFSNEKDKKVTKGKSASSNQKKK